MNFHRKLTAALLSACIVGAGVPAGLSISAEEALLTRDPFYNFSSNYHYYTTEHFQFIWGNGEQSAKITNEFLEGNGRNLEACWDVYMNELEMAAPTESVNLSLRDGKQYKMNLYISNTGLAGMENDWAYMSYDNQGYAYMFCCPDSMQYNPPSWVLPHEFGHAVTAHQLGWNENKYSYAWWESMGNWFREQYLYSDYSNDNTGHGTDFFETYMKNLSLTFPCGRDYYAAWPILQYLTENPDNMDGYGTSFVKTMLQQGQVDEFPLDMIDRLAPADMKDTLGNFGKHMATLDFRKGDAYRARLQELCSAGSWNWQQIYTMLDPIAGMENTYQVPTERAPQAAGMNIIPLKPTGSTIRVSLTGKTNIKGADWRAAICQRSTDGKCTYSPLFSDGDTMEAAVVSNLEEAYLVVVATPDSGSYTKTGLPYGPGSEFSEEKVPFTSKQQYPYAVTISGADMVQRTVATGNNWWETYHNHSNGGGLVSDSAKVDDSVYVAPNAKVLGSATVSGNARIEDYAVVQDSASVSGNAVIAGYAIVAERAKVKDNARVDDTALVMGNVVVSGHARVTESACVYGDYTVSDYACAKGMAFCMAGGSLSGQAVADGDYYEDGNKQANKGTVYGWVSSQEYVSSRPYTDKLMAAYDFTQDSSLMATDRYTSTYGTSYGEPVWESSRTGATGVMTFDGSEQFVQLDRGLLYTDDIDLQTAFLTRSDKEQTLLSLGNDTAYLKIKARNAAGHAEVTLSNGTAQTTWETADALPLGEWTVLRFVLENGKGTLSINGTDIATTNCTIKPSGIASAVLTSDKAAAYRLGADADGGNAFKGSVDFLRSYYGKAEAPTETYTEKEDISTTPDQPVLPEKELIMIGDADYNAVVNVFDLARMKYYLRTGAVLDAKGTAACDTDGNGSFGMSDAVTLAKYLVKTIDAFPAGVIAEYQPEA